MRRICAFLPADQLTLVRSVNGLLELRLWAALLHAALDGGKHLGLLLALALEVGAGAANGRGAVEEARLRARRDGRQRDADAVLGRGDTGNQDGSAGEETTVELHCFLTDVFFAVENAV